MSARKFAGWRQPWAWVALAVIAAGSCARTTPEQALRETMGALEQSVEARRAGALGSHLHADFAGPGGMDRDGTVRMARGMFLRYRGVTVVLGPASVELLDDTQARVRFTAALAGGSGSGLPSSGRVYEVETGWRVEDGEWRLLSADWTPRF